MQTIKTKANSVQKKTIAKGNAKAHAHSDKAEAEKLAAQEVEDEKREEAADKAATDNGDDAENGNDDQAAVVVGTSKVTNEQIDADNDDKDDDSQLDQDVDDVKVNLVKGSSKDAAAAAE